MTSTQKGTILVVDDDRLVLATLSHGLSQAGYDVIDADNGDDAILLAREHRPDLALLDIRMQGMSGFDVAEYLRTYSHMPFMFLSAFSDAQTAAQVKALGAVAYLVKPLDIGQILPVVDAAFANLAAQRDEVAEVPPQDTTKPPAKPASRSAASAELPAPEVMLAIGVLMQRFTLTRVAAFEHLSRLAAGQGGSLESQADEVLDSVERLASPKGA